MGVGEVLSMLGLVVLLVGMHTQNIIRLTRVETKVEGIEAQVAELRKEVRGEHRWRSVDAG